MALLPKRATQCQAGAMLGFGLCSFNQACKLFRFQKTKNPCQRSWQGFAFGDPSCSNCRTYKVHFICSPASPQNKHQSVILCKPLLESFPRLQGRIALPAPQEKGLPPPQAEEGYFREPGVSIADSFSRSYSHSAMDDTRPTHSLMMVQDHHPEHCLQYKQAFCSCEARSRNANQVGSRHHA